MQYLLTREEFDGLVLRQELDAAKDAIKRMRRMIVPEGKCVHDTNGPFYCDECQLHDFTQYEQSRLMCNLKRSYSK
jgi:hypothetical protein